MKPKARFTSLLAAFFLAGHVSGQESEPTPAEEQNLEAASLPFRTALHHDPTLDAPLQQLVKLYQVRGQVPDVLELYKNHLAVYPGDRNSLIVYLRLLLGTGAPESLASSRQAAETHAEDAYLQFLLFENLRRAAQSGAVDALDKAISLEKDPIRRKAWIAQFAPLAVESGRLERAASLLQESAKTEQSAEKKLEIARVMLTNQLFAGALEVLKEAAQANPGAEASVEISLATASAQVGLNDAKSASETLDALLNRLTADYWRRPEVFRRRIALIEKESERTAMIDAARARLKKSPNSEAAVIDLSLLLDHFEFRREALEVLVEAGKKLPRSGAIEKATFDLLDLLRDEQAREKLLAEKLKADPSRLDLQARRVETLFALNRREEALREMKTVAGKLPKPEQVRYLTELARKLRRSSLPSASAVIYEEVLPLAPDRLDLRRELAETLIAAGKREKALELFSGPLPESTETENLIDLVQFLLQQKLNIPARSALEAVLVKVPNDFDLNLLMLQIEGRLADRANGAARLDKLRTLADSAARYRKWLEAGIAFHQMFEEEDNFLTVENERLKTNQYDGQFDRRLAMIDAFSVEIGKSEGIQMLKELVEDPATPQADRIAARRDLAKALETKPDAAAEFTEQLQKLIEEDTERETEHRARLAVFNMRNGSSAGANLIGDLDPAKISDPGVLIQVRDMFVRMGGSYGVQDKMQQILRRILELSPADRATWEQWLLLTASTGDEDQLRMNLRKLLAGIDQMPLSNETRSSLSSHLVASYWRSIAKKIGTDKNTELADALPLCAEVETVSQNRNDLLWAAWARSYLLNRLGRGKERDATVRELTRLASEPNEKGKIATQINFPDGVGISVDQAQRILTAAPISKPNPLSSRNGPIPPYAVRWAFDVNPGANVTSCLPTGEKWVLVVDSANTIYGLDRETGKLAWQKRGPANISAPTTDSGRFPASVPVPVTNGKDLLFVPNGPSVECWSVADGNVLWRSDGLGSTTAHANLQAASEKLFVYSAESNRLTALDSRSGKILWQRQFPVEKKTQPNGQPMIASMNSGIVAAGDRIFLYGPASYVVSAENGETLWSFGNQLSSFPIRLLEKDEKLNPPPINPQRGYSQQPPREMFYANQGTLRVPGNYGRPRGEYSSMGIAPGTTYYFSAPTLTWQQAQNNFRRASFDGSNLFLSSTNSGCLFVSLDTPFLATACQSQGAVAAFDGRRAVIQYGNSFGIFDSASGAIRNLAMERSGQSEYQYDEFNRLVGAASVALDGPMAYTSSPAGIAMFRLSLGEVVDQQPWPESVAPPATEKEEDPQVLDQTPITKRSQLMAISQNARKKAVSTPVVVSAGLLFASPIPSRLVALTSAERKEPPPTPQP